MAAASPAEQPSFAVRRTGPADSARPLKELGLRAFALAVKYGASASASDPASLRLAQSTAGTIAGQLQRLAPLALWKDWVPPRAEPSQEVPVGKDSAFASSCKKTDEFAPGKALEDGTTTCWTSGAGKSSFWGVNFGRRVQLSWAAFAFKGTNLPDNVEIEVTDSESAPARADWRAVGRKYAGKDIKGTLNVDFRVPIAARQLRLQFNGSAPGNTDSVVSLSRVRFGEVLGSDSYTPPGTALGQLQAWFAGVAGAGAAGLAVSPASAAAGSVSAEAFEAGIRGLVGLARSSGSLRTLLRLAQALLTAPQRQLSPATAAAGLALLESLRRQAALERTAQSAAEYVPRIPDRPDGDGAASAGGAAGAAGGPKPAVAAPAAASSGASTGPLVDISDVARWDTGCMSAQLDVSEEGKTVRSTDGSYTHCLMRLGATGEKGVTSGRLEWEMKLVEDTDSQCSCFGASTKPITTSNYDSSSAFWMYRSYNGYRYHGSQLPGSSSNTRVYKGNTVRFVLDFEDGADGTMSMWINDAAQGVVFTGFRGKEVWPAVAFYGSGRVVSILSVKRSRQAGDKGAGAGASRALTSLGLSDVGIASSAFLSDLPEHHAVVGQGALGKNGDLGYGKAGDGRKVKVEGTDVKRALSMHPPAATAAAAMAAAAAAATAAASAEEADGAGAGAGAGAESADGAVSGGAGAASQEAPDARKERLLAAAHADTRGVYAGTASVVYWLGKGQETLSGSVALADSATAEARNAPDASPVFFEVYGDGRLLWRSAPVMEARSPAQPFSVRVLGVEVLRLVTRVAAGGGSNGAHAVWMDPLLTTTTEWCAYGWRNDRAAMTDALTGVPRGGDLPLPSPLALGLVAPADRAAAQAQAAADKAAPATTAAAVAGSAWPAPAAAWLSTAHGLAAGLLRYAGLLAGEHLRGMRDLQSPGAGDLASADLEAPFALQPCEGAVADVAALVSLLAEGRYSASPAAAASLSLASLATAAADSNGLDAAAQADAAASLVRLLTANLRRVMALGVDPSAVGLLTPRASAAGAGASKPVGGAGSGAAAGGEASKAVAGVVGQLYKAAAWGGAAAGRKLADGSAAAGAAASAASAAALASSSSVFAAASVQDAVWELLELGSGVVQTPELRSSHIVRAAAGGAGTVELQLNWPSDAIDADGTMMQLETVLLRVQLFASQAGLRTRLFGRWPAKVYLVVEIPASAASASTGGGSSAGVAEDKPASVRDFLDGSLADILESVDLPAPGEARDGVEALPLRIERRADWNRAARLAVEPAMGAVRVYPAFAATFDDVTAALRAFVPVEGGF